MAFFFIKTCNSTRKHVRTLLLQKPSDHQMPIFNDHGKVAIKIKNYLIGSISRS